MNLNAGEALFLLREKLFTWYEAAIKAIPNILVALLVMIFFIICARIAKNIVSRVLPRITRHRAAINLMRSIVYILVLSIGLFVSLGVLNLDKTVTSILAGAGVIGLALGFAFQEIASNFVSGILIAFQEPYQLGDIIEIDSYFGEVTKISLRTTSVTTFQGLEVLIPNKDMFTKPFINFTTTPDRRLDLNVGVSYGDDLDLVEEITKEALLKVEDRVESKDIDVFFEEFGNSSINLVARVWIHYPRNKAYAKARHQAVKAIKAAFDQHNITIPFPIRTLDFALAGGEKFKGMLPRGVQREEHGDTQH